MRFAFAAMILLLATPALGLTQSRPQPPPPSSAPGVRDLCAEDPTCYGSSPSSPNASSSPALACPAGSLPTGDVKDKKTGKITQIICTKMPPPAQPFRLPPQQQGIPIGNVPKATDQAGRETPYVDPGAVAPSSAIEDLLNPKEKPKGDSCQELLDYRDHKLAHDFQVAIEQHDLYIAQKEQDFALAKQTAELMDQGWWGGKLTGGHGTLFAQVAIDVKFVTDELNSFLAIINPQESVVLERITAAGDVIDIVHSDVDEGAKEASKEAGKTAYWTLTEDIGKLNKDSQTLQTLGGYAGMVHGAADYAEHTEQMEQTQDAIQEDVRNLVQSSRNWQDKAVEAQAKAQMIQQISKAISTYCSTNGDVEIRQPD